MTNPLGVPVDVEGWWDLSRRLRARRGRSAESLVRQGRWEERVSHQLGRWPVASPHGVEPAPYVPADVLMLRTLAAGLDLGLGLPDPSSAPPYRGALAALVMDGIPHWLAPRSAQGITHSHPPADEMMVDLRLPYDAQVVWFGAPARLGPASGVISDVVAASVRDARGPGGRVRLDDVPWELAVGAAALVSADPADAPREMVEVSVEGVVLVADAEGHPSDLMAWVLAALPPASPLRSRPIRCVVPALRSRAGLDDAVSSLMAVVAWGEWAEPAGPPIGPGADRKALRAWLRRHDPSLLGPVRVLDAARRPPPTRSEPDGRTHASPIAHLRRGHWRRQWLPSVDEHRPTWIPPVLVNPGGVDDEQVVVWRLPV